MGTDHIPRVVVTRSSDQASRLSEGLRRHGLIAVEVPLIAMQVTAQHRNDLQQILQRVEDFDWVTLTSPNAVAVFFDATDATDALDGSTITTPKIAVVGPGTEEAVKLRGGVASLVSATASGEGLLQAMRALSPTKVLCAQAAAARPTLADGLRFAGWDVAVLTTYETISVRPSNQVLAEVAQCDAIAFASSSSVEAWIAAFPDLTNLAHVTPALVVSIGPQTTATAAAAGFTVSGEAQPHTIDGLVAAVVAALSARTA